MDSGGENVGEKEQLPRISEISASRITVKINNSRYDNRENMVKRKIH
jgi:hypothetical protein